MSELSFEQMLEDSVKTIRNGEIVQGTVIDVKEDEIILNIGYKADGIITKNEYSNDASLVLTDAVHHCAGAVNSFTGAFLLPVHFWCL